MLPVSVVIPNYNGKEYIEGCLESLIRSEKESFEIIVVDDMSSDGSDALVEEGFPAVTLIRNGANMGFSASVNVGIRASKSPFVFLLNNDTKVEKGTLSALIRRIRTSKAIFSVQARMVSMQDPSIIDSAGDTYNLLGWARAAGKDKDVKDYLVTCDIFSSCAGAALYRRSVLLGLGLFDEKHFAYLEDVDIGYRARLYGYRNVYEPEAVILHAGSAASGSRYNAFKTELTSGNALYLAYKNMAPLQLILNLPFLTAGHVVKLIFFAGKGMFLPYIKGIRRGIGLMASGKRAPDITGKPVKLYRYVAIELQLIKNLLRLLPF